jgi:hypothetical protein
MITSLNFPQAISWLDRYRSPDYESSLWKGIPIAYRHHPAVSAAITGQNELGVRLRAMYRGKSKPMLGYKRKSSYVPKEFADTFALYPVSNYRAETSLSSRKADTSGMNEPITYPVGTGNVIGSHSAQDFVWAGRAEGSQAQTSGETATHTPADTNTPYAGPITEPIGSDVHYGAEKFGIKGFNQYVGVVATAIGIGGVASILIGGQKFVQDIPWYLGGEIIRGVKTSWNAKDAANKTLMLLTFGSLLYLGSNTTLLSWKFLSNKTIVSG